LTSKSTTQPSNKEKTAEETHLKFNNHWDIPVKDRGKLTEIKRTLRQRMLDSPLCDAEGFARKFEAALRKMWQQWCEEKAGK